MTEILAKDKDHGRARVEDLSGCMLAMNFLIVSRSSVDPASRYFQVIALLLPYEACQQISISRVYYGSFVGLPHKRLVYCGQDDPARCARATKSFWVVENVRLGHRSWNHGTRAELDCMCYKATISYRLLFEAFPGMSGPKSWGITYESLVATISLASLGCGYVPGHNKQAHGIWSTSPACSHDTDTQIKKRIAN